jgi:hypothetical protein
MSLLMRGVAIGGAPVESHRPCCHTHDGPREGVEQSQDSAIKGLTNTKCLFFGEINQIKRTLFLITSRKQTLEESALKVEAILQRQLVC